MDREDLRRAAERFRRPANESERRYGDGGGAAASRRSDDPRLDVDVLQSVMSDAAEGAGEAHAERLEALMSWRDALVRRHVLARRLASTEPAPPPAPLPAAPDGNLPDAAGLVERVGAASREALDLRGLTRASNHAAIDTFTPDFSHHGPIRRALARAAARVTRLFSRFLISRQSVVNSVLVDFVAESGDRLNEQQAHLDRLVTSVQEILERQRDATAHRLRELRDGSETLRAGIHDLRGSLDELGRRGLEHELRLTEADCDRAWSRVAEVDEREDLARIRRELESLGGRLGAQSKSFEGLRRRLAASDGLGESLDALSREQPALREKLREQEDEVESLGRRVAGQERELASHDERASGLARAVAGLEELLPRLAALEKGVAEVEEASQVLALENERARAGTYEESSGHLGAALDGLYVNLENHFRGSRELIKERLRSYVPLLVETGAGAVDRPILDVGCGRGEWLELLAERGLQARGVEINNVAVSNCRSLGLDVTAADALGYLREQPSGAFGMVTAFHVLEHLPFEYMVDLFGETLRVLRPEGVALFETPNPENLLVSASSFHFDPTHRQPLVPELLVFLLQQQGFLKVRVERQTAGRPEERLEELDAADPLAERLNQVIGVLNRHFAAPSDFAVVARKPV